jgi:hypothetical protein
MSATEAPSVGPWTRVRIALAVGISLALFAIAGSLATWLAERPGLRTRLDVTHTRRNTLDPVLFDLVKKLPERAFIDVFFQPMPPQIGEAGAEVQRRVGDLLDVMRNAAPEKISVIFHGSESLTDVRAALSRLKVDGDEYGMLVVHREKRTAVLRLFKDIAQLDFGNPDPNHFTPPRMVSFRGEEALAGALMRVASDQPLKIYFTTGHGERKLYSAASSEGNESTDLGALASALVNDGFETERFDGKGNPLPSDCAALAIVDPTQALTESEVSAIHAYIDRGGRVLVTGSHRYPDGAGSTRELVSRYGLDLGAGYVAEPVAGPNGYVVGRPDCANIFSGPEGLQVRHPVTESLAHFGRTVWSALSRPLSRKNPPSNVTLTELVRSSDTAWVDLPDASGTFDWNPDKQREVAGKRFGLAFACELTPSATSSAHSDQQLGRLIVLGSPELLTSRLLVTNKDFALNAFNWLAARDYRLNVAPRSEERHLLEVRQGNKLVELRSLALFLLPGLCAIFGLLTWYRRRR